MFVVSRVGSGEDGKADAALLPQAIGNIQTIIGSGTLWGASGVAVEVMIGDPVCQGDIIETAADGRIGIRFIDGTVFNLSGSTRVVLSEFVYNSTGTTRSASFGVIRGAFAFIAGQVAKNGCLTVDTHVGSIRARAQTGGIGMLWLTALTFSLMKEVQAADPNVTLLDDDNITYKDLEHGTFELVTKEVIPRYFLVEDPGQTITLRSQGSSVSVSQSTNSAARMAELQAAQQEALATFEKGLGSTGSSTPPPLERLPVQPINFIPIDHSSPAQDLPPLPPSIFASVPDIIVAQQPPPPPQPLPPTLNAVLGPTETDTVVFDVFTATSGTFLASSPNSAATLTFGIDGGTTGSVGIDGVTYDVSKAGPYGTLYLDSATGAYTFVPDSDAINALTAPSATDFTITVSDGTLSANQTFTIAINGANDAAIISGSTSDTVIEASGVANTTLGSPSATGTLTNTDVDNAPNTFTAVSLPTASAKGFGTFTMTAAGVWDYNIDQANSAVQALNVGDTLTDTFTVTTIDGTPQVVTVTINGANDAAVISGATTGSVTEDSGATCGTPTAIGTLTDTDVDNTPNRFTAVSCPTASDSGYGAFTMKADGLWTYKLDNANCVVQALDDGDTLTDTFTVTTIDGTPQVVTIIIHGASDADPNDFDHLATGLAVICDPPYVYGTPGGDSIAGGHHGQIIYGGAGNDTINGTGKCDLIYAGSGNDTVKGNDGDDKIYGGSGSDTINGNNGCDTIIGGYGADNLRGGNGNDRFVYLSVADSNSAQFDTISDFASGSDRIDLTALGALAFADLALTSTSTSVPKHAIVWFYDSTANQTIVYANPTDQILSVGSSALLEIHLQGLATIEPSDFVFIETTTSAQALGEPIDLAVAAGTDESAVTTIAANVLSNSTVDDGTLPANGSRSLQTTDVGYSFDVDQDQIDLIDYAKFASFDEVRTHSTENTGGHPATALVNAQSIVLQGFHVTEPIASNFTFEASAESDPTNARAIPSTHDYSSGNHGQAVERFMANLTVAWTDLDDQSEASGHSAGAIHVVGEPGDTLSLGDSFHFNDGTSEGLEITDVTGMDFASASISYYEHAARTGREYATVQAAQTVELSLLGQHSADGIHVFQHRAGGGIVHHLSHDLMV